MEATFEGLVSAGLEDKDARLILESRPQHEAAFRVIADLAYGSKNVTDKGGLAKHYLATIRRVAELYALPRVMKSKNSV